MATIRVEGSRGPTWIYRTHFRALLSAVASGINEVLSWVKERKRIGGTGVIHNAQCVIASRAICSDSWRGAHKLKITEGAAPPPIPLNKYNFGTTGEGTQGVGFPTPQLGETSIFITAVCSQYPAAFNSYI